MFFHLASADSDVLLGGAALLFALTLIGLVVVLGWIVDSHFRAMRQLQSDTNHYLKLMTQEVTDANAKRPADAQPNLPKSD